MTIVFVFKNGFELRMKCRDFLLNRNGLGMATGYEAKGLTENKPIWFDFENVLCIYRVLSDEGDLEEPDVGKV